MKTIYKLSFKVLMCSFLLSVFFIQNAKAQLPTTIWANSMGGTSLENPKGIATDNAGNVYTTGFFRGTADFDASATTYNLTSNGSNDVFVTKSDANGNFIWAKSFGNTGDDAAFGIAVDVNGNVYIAGYYSGTVNFNPSGTASNYTSVGLSDAFITKLDSNGNFIFAKSFGGSTNDFPYGLSLDVNANIYILGSYGGTCDFDPSTSTYNLTSGGSSDIFVSKLDANGSFIWAKSFGGTGIDVPVAISLDANGNIYTTGTFNGTADFDPSTNTHNLVSNGGQDVFISKLDNNGNYIWAKSIGGANADYNKGITVDASTNVYIIGYFSGTVDFDPNSGVSNLTSGTGSNSCYILKLDMNGNYVWAKTISGATTAGYAITTDANYNVYSTGIFVGTADFDPSNSTYNLTANSTSGDTYVQKLDVNGNFLWAENFGGSTGATASNNIALDNKNNILLTGYYNNTVNFNPSGTAINLTSAGGQDVFVIKMGTPCTPTTYTNTQTACDSFYWADKNQWYYANNNTDTVHLTNVGGCDSLVTLNLIINTSTHNVTTQTACDSYVWNGRTYKASTTDTFSYVNSNGCASVDTLYLTINNSTSTLTTASACGSYTWLLNSQVYTSSGTYTVASTNAAGCTHIDSLVLTINTPTNNVTTTSACDSYMWNGRTYTTTTTDTFSYVNSNGCASVDTLFLTINSGTFTTNSQTVCDSLVWNSVTYKISGIYVHNYNNTNGCASADTLFLTVNNSSTSTTNQTACGSYLWNGITYTTSGTYNWKGTNAVGCDSTAILNLSILSNIASIDIINSGAYCGDTAFAQLSTNISAANFPGVAYAWSKQDYISNTWSMFSNDSVININDAYPTQYVVQVSIPGCGNYFSNQKMVMPINKPNATLSPISSTEICNNSNVNFSVNSADGGVNNYAFYSNATLLQNDTTTQYVTPNLTTVNSGVVYTVEATNTKPTFDGDIAENFWGKPLAVSTWGPSSGFGAGHELNAVYSRADNDNLYLAIAGNVQNSNRIMVFIDSKNGGYNTGNYGRNGIGNNAIKNFNSGNVFDPGFDADYCLGIGTDAGRTQFYFDLVELQGVAAGGTSISNYIGSNLAPASGYSIGANPANNTQTQGFEIAIPKSAIGYTGGDVRVFIAYSADNGFLSNQFLTRANVGAGNYGSGVVNFGAASPGHIAIPMQSLSQSCKSTLTTVVTVKPNATSLKYDTVCNNALPYSWAGKQFVMAGTYNDTSLGSNGCDSIATLMLFVKDTSISNELKTLCSNALPYSWNGNSYSVAGTYTWKGLNAYGCDSIATLILNISDTTTSVTTTSSCNKFLWSDGNTYTTSGTYTWKGLNAYGCDSIATLNLTINQSPAKPMITTSSTNVNVPATGVVYSCTTVPNVFTYVWSYTGTGATIATGQGTENIIVDFAANATDGKMQVVAVSLEGCNSEIDTVSIVLPISISKFIVVQENNKSKLTWYSSLEINAKEYQVERSIDGRNFENIGKVTANGSASQYEFVDSKLPATVKIIYYRLKLIDKDGKFTYSEIKQLSINSYQLSISLYPNPTKNTVNVKVNDAKQIRVIDMLGKVLLTNNNVIKNGITPIPVNSLSKGIYYIEVTNSDGKTEIQKFVKE
ncbi:MAG: T9SS type A sorting domain-containing protein [Chitinophagaceae bacterium]